MNPKSEDFPVFQRIVLKNAAPYQYMKVKLVLEDKSINLIAVDFKQFIISGLRNLHGEVGAAVQFDVLKYNENTLTAFLRVPKSDLVKLWSSLTLSGQYYGRTCAFRVLLVSPFLLSLTANSRELKLD
ncbi:ribonuclease P protein subunit p14 [Stigmatopora nigra]